MIKVIERERITEEVKKIVADIVDWDASDINDEMSLLDDLGIDSLDLIDLLSSLEKVFQVDVKFEFWTEKISAEALKIEELGSEKTLQNVSQQTGLYFEEGDIESLNELLDGEYQVWDVIRMVLSFIKVKTLVDYVNSRLGGDK